MKNAASFHPCHLLSLALSWVLLVTSASAATDPPNIILIFADDLGYGDVGCYREGKAVGSMPKTPEIDRLAAGGFRSTDCLVAANVCGPSRAALLTGRYPMRCGHPISRHPFPKYEKYGLAPEELTIPELLKKAGYHNKMAGKWHLGFHVEGSHPLDAGFDDYLGLTGNYITEKNRPDGRRLYRNREVERENIPFNEVTKLYTDEVVDFIEEKREEPFFVYFSHHIAHTPILPSEEFKGATGVKGKAGLYRDFVLELDHSVGRVRQAVEEAGIAKETLIVFLSDNGPAASGSAHPLLGGKYVTMEGGHRVPGIFYWPGRIPKGEVSDAMITSMDLLPLFAGVAGVPLPDDRNLDGKDILHLLTGETKESPHDFFYYYNGLNLQAVRNEKWKLHLPRKKSDQPYWAVRGAGPRKPHLVLEKPLLFDLDSDPSERKNAISQQPEVVAELTKEAERARTEIGDVEVIGSDQRPHGLVDPNAKGDKAPAPKAAAAAVAPAPAAKDSPNILFLLADDLGWSDVGYQNPKVIESPAIDKLAASGTVFHSAYAAAVCSPSRAEILTGKSPARLHLTSHIPGAGMKTYLKKSRKPQHRLYEAEIRDRLPLEEVTIAEALGAGDYQNAFFGKWHLAGEGSRNTRLGMVLPECHPQHQGFAINVAGNAYGQPAAGPKGPYFSPYKNGEIENGPDGEYLTDRLAAECIDFMKGRAAAKDGKPFFAYLSFYSIHLPLKPRPGIKGQDRYGQMIASMDHGVAEVLKALDELGLREETLVVFTSDNGGFRPQPPFRGQKGSVYEGGTRVPLVFSWPGMVKAGRVIQTPVAAADLFPTLLEVAGLPVPKESGTIDGVSYASALTGSAEMKARPVFQHFPHHRNSGDFNGASTVRNGDWKLRWNHEDDEYLLYNLKEDIAESSDLAAKHPEKTKELRKALDEWLKHTGAKLARVNPDHRP